MRIIDRKGRLISSHILHSLKVVQFAKPWKKPRALENEGPTLLEVDFIDLHLKMFQNRLLNLFNMFSQ